MYIGLGGAVTFKNAKKPVEVAAMLPADRLVLETDAPYMTPVPFRGKRCHSGYIAYTAEKIAEIRGISVESLLRQTCENACSLYGITL
jgi:TatD DNase family protein